LRLKAKSQVKAGQIFQYVSRELDHQKKKQVAQPRFLQRISHFSRHTKVRQDEGEGEVEENEDDAAPAGLAHEGFLRIASIHFASADAHPPIPLGEDEDGNDQEYKLNLIFGNQHTQGEQSDCPQGAAGAVDMSAVFRENEAYTEDSDIPAVDAFYFRLSDQNLYYA